MTTSDHHRNHSVLTHQTSGVRSDLSPIYTHGAGVRHSGMAIPSSTTARGISAFLLHWARSDTRNIRIPPLWLEALNLFPYFPLSLVLSKRALIFLGFLGQHTLGTASR